MIYRDILIDAFSLLYKKAHNNLVIIRIENVVCSFLYLKTNDLLKWIHIMPLTDENKIFATYDY